MSGPLGRSSARFQACCGTSKGDRRASWPTRSESRLSALSHLVQRPYGCATGIEAALRIYDPRRRVPARPAGFRSHLSRKRRKASTALLDDGRWPEDFKQALLRNGKLKGSSVDAESERSRRILQDVQFHHVQHVIRIRG